MARILGTWLRRALGLAILLAIILLIWHWSSIEGERLPTTAEIMAKEPTQKFTLAVSTNVQVSKANALAPHVETVVAADPLHPSLLCAAAMYFASADGASSVICYRSEDSGNTWQPSFARQPHQGENHVDDPSLAFGPDGVLYFVCMPVSKTTRKDESTASPRDQGSFEFHRSLDGGKTWELRGTVQEGADRPFLDRPFLIVDASTEKYRGRLYCASHELLSTLADGAMSFSHVAYFGKGGGGHEPATAALLTDGTLALGYRLWSGKTQDRPGLQVLLSDDGGRTLREVTSLNGQWYDERIRSGKFWFAPQLTADTANAAYRDRLYAVWEDGNAAPEPGVPGPGRVLFAFSQDKGQTWIGPTILSEQPAQGNAGYGAYMPCLAVNKDGVVAVTWYDRRGLHTFPGPRAPYYAPECNVRIRVSPDGGDAWSPSVQINEETIQATVYELRDTAGLAADANGTFHPVWIDDRTGTRQVWTAKVAVTR